MKDPAAQIEKLRAERDEAQRELQAVLTAQGELNTKYKIQLRLIVDENEKLRAELAEFRTALENIAKQPLPDELEDELFPDYEFGYEVAVEGARFALGVPDRL